ncbi:transglycosylase SLT domain-containing protein [Myxococcus sp. RHSTA-1-4]|uniref:lytic transglycosylase domain-containing protein n=1 Tax=Myxococcus sp. RHSTA-1-4 TaxID=2874601 RepID=UPI001CBE468E|nr:transglycosylase SLT domain-containing protein [Myxococcus sp. RHSTA-1-4]MBZ4419925.1 transglycosylase SLT domain-containing protein [Myxococcus sp. RHSTA-1-4]
MSWTGLVAGLVAGVALGQSPATLEAVRLHKPEAAGLARDELAACVAKKCPDAGRLALLAGTLALSDGRAAEARDILAAWPPPALLAPYHAFYLGQARFYAGDAVGAAADFSRVLEARPPAELAARARARLGESLLKAGKAKEALASLEAAAKATPTPELVYQRGLARGAVGNRAGQVADLLAVALRHPTHPYADEAVKWLTGGRKPAVKWGFAERTRRADGFLDAGAPQRALEELEALEGVKLAKGQPAAVALLRARAFFALKQEEAARKALAVAEKGPPDVAAEAALLVARRALRADDNDKARALMAGLDAKYPSQPAGDEGAFFAGWLDLQAGRFADAVKAFGAFHQRYPRSRRRDEGLWFRSLAHLRLEEYTKARETLEALVEAFPRSNMVPQARYWVARSQELEGAKADVVGPAYEALVTSAPASFYALMAAERLKALGRAPPAHFPHPPKQLELPRPPELELAMELTRAGLFRDAADEVEAQAARVRSADQALPFAHALLKLGEYGHAHAVAARHLWGRAFGSREPDALAAFYPRAFANAVQDAAAKARVDPFLVWAIMRRESAFKPEVMSAADARGLMQIIPPTATAIAERLAEPAPAPADLFSPERNIRYGAWYLSRLMERFRHPVLAAAAYNAGPGPTVKWALERGRLPLDLFVETIPFKETRAYVKQVVADLFLYHAFYGNGAEPLRLSLQVPEPAKEGVTF